MKQPNPNQGLNARRRRILRNLRSSSFASVKPFRAQRLKDDNGKIFKLRTYRDEVEAKSPEQLLLAKLRELSLRQLLRRRTQAEHALSRAEANHERAETPAEKGSLWPQVSIAEKFLVSVVTEISRRGKETEHLERLADLTPREIRHKLHHGHKAWKRAIRRREHCAIPSLALRTREESGLHHRNITLTTALRKGNSI